MIKITTIIPTYNQENYIDDAIFSACRQIGEFKHEIIVSSDGSTDGTRRKIKEWQSRYPMLVRDISEDFNVGISSNFRRLFSAASGKYIAILEGDDIWIDNEKIEKQKNFLDKNIECSMVFSTIKIVKLPSKNESFLSRQSSITKDKLLGEDFIAEPTMNLIANFSSCMLKKDLVSNFPDRLFVGRFNEIAMAFYLEKFGPIGFLNEVMSIYHQHSGGVWTGISREDQLKSGMETREMVLEIADKRHHKAINDIIEAKYKKPLEEIALSKKI